MGNRKSLTKKIRFEVFKRDKFTCQYCGKSAPHVVLNVDHIKPVSKGGTNDILNLITCCFDCNSGKNDRSLSDDSVVLLKKQQLDDLQEKREQLEMMMQWNEELVNLQDQTVEKVHDFWRKLIPNYHLSASGISTLKKLLKKYSVAEVVSAMQKACASYLEWTNAGATKESVETAWNKVPGICSLTRSDNDEPELKDFFYIRAIIRNRLSYYVPHQTIEWLKAAYSWGATISELKSIATSVRSWSEFSHEIDRIIEKYKTDASK